MGPETWPASIHDILATGARRAASSKSETTSHTPLGPWAGPCYPLIRPFCIMLLYQYLLHYGLLLHIMSQYLCLFSVILQGLHKEGECRQLEFWAGKGPNIRDLFCTTPKVL